MASGNNGPYRTPHRNRSFNDDDIENRIRRREYSERETYIPSSNAAQHFQARPDMLPNFSQMQLNDDDTSSQTRQHLAELQAEIAEEEDSATIVRSPPPAPRHGPSTREQTHKSEEKLVFIRARKKEITQLFETMKRSQTVDLCFLIDCTGSMDPYIAQVKTKIDNLVEHCKMTFPDLVLKLAFVGYRDHCDREKRIISLPFTGDIAYFKSFVSKIQADGGGDAAEDVFGGLEKAGELQWSAPTRILFHVADAPCHGKQYHDDVLDDWPNGDPRSLKAKDLLKVLEDKNVKYWFAKLTDKTDKMITEFTRLMRMPTMLQQVRNLSNNTMIFNTSSCKS
jgi:hypothetical protein